MTSQTNNFHYTTRSVNGADLENFVKSWNEAQARYNASLASLEELHKYIHFLVTGNHKTINEVAEMTQRTKQRISVIVCKVERQLKGGDKS